MRRKNFSRLDFIKNLALLFLIALVAHSCGDSKPTNEELTAEQKKKELEKVEAVATYATGQEIDYRTADQLTMKATVYKPASLDGNYPTVVILPSPTGLDTASQKYLATEFANRGIVALVIHGRGTPPSTGTTQSYPYDSQKEDALLAYNELLKDKNVNQANMGFVGFADAAELAVYCAAASTKSAFVVAGSFRPLTAEQKLNSANWQSISPELAKSQMDFLSKKIDWNQYEAIQKKLSPNADGALRQPTSADDTYWSWLQSWQAMEAFNLPTKMKARGLFLYGSNDVPATENVDNAIDNAEKMGSKAKLELRKMAGADLVSQYRKQQLSADVLDNIADWIKSNNE